MKKNILKIYNEYKEEFLNYLKVLSQKTKKICKRILDYCNAFKENILKKEKRKKYLTTTGVLIFINILLINIYVSYGYYYEEATFPLIKAKVGNIYSEYDYVLLVYLETTDSTGNGDGKYRLSNSIPELGYNYSGYKCQNNSTLIYDEETKITSVTTEQKELCSVYFDVIGSIDLKVQIMLEDNVGSNTYTVGERIPVYGYKYSYYECENNGKLEYDSELHKIKMTSSTNEYCSVYFIKEFSDISVRLYVEENYQTGDYIERLSIPSNKSYILNDTKSMCVNNSNERLDTEISYVEGYINIESSEIMNCSIYLDKENE